TQARAIDQDIAWWRGVLERAPQLELASDFPRPASPTHRCGSIPVQLPGHAVGSLRALAADEGTTPLVVLLAAFRLLLARSTGQSSLVLGTTQAASATGHLVDACGPFSDYLALRVDLTLAGSFRELVRLERDHHGEALGHGRASFDRIVESLSLERDVTRHPLFQAFFQLDTSSAEELAWSGLHATPVPLAPRYSLFDVTLKLSLRGNRLQGWLGYDEAVYRPQTGQRLADRFVALLEAALRLPDASLDAHSMLTPHEQQRLLEWNATAAPFPEQTLLHEFLEQQAGRTPDAVALVFEGQSLSYREVNAQANQLAGVLRRLGVAPGERVGVLLERSLDMVLALYATLKAGAAYVPLDPDYPVDRLLGMLDD
ncbi:MAG: non-ribosomal peptide synthetase, partial [Myxococcales bacterium]